MSTPQIQEGSKKRAAPPHDPDGAPPEAKRQRIATKQKMFALIAKKFPQAEYGQNGAQRKMPWESVDEDVQPVRRPQDGQDQGARPAPLQLTDLECTRKLGDGGYGMVLAARVRKRQRPHLLDAEGAQVAVKVLHKRQYREHEPEDEAAPPRDRMYDEKAVERTNLHALPWHPFVAGAYDCLADTRNLYILQEAGLGGTLGQLLRARGALPTSVCRFFLANIVLALEHIQAAGIVHGDIKPDNLVLGADGFLMLADFGVSSRWDERRRWDAVGTLPYTSPEFALQRTGVDARRALDWWSVGCVLYEMATGKAAFRTKKGAPAGGDSRAREEELTRRVMRGHYFWPADADVDRDLRDLVDRMLRYDLARRCGPPLVDVATGVVPKHRQIREHRFLSGFPWQDMADRTLVAPYGHEMVPDTSKGWQHHQMPAQAKVPGLPRLIPLLHLEWDRRFTSQKRRELRDERKEQLNQEQHQQADPVVDPNEDEVDEEEDEAKKQEEAETNKQIVERLLRVKRLHERGMLKRKASKGDFEASWTWPSPGKQKEAKEGVLEESTTTGSAKGKQVQGSGTERPERPRTDSTQKSVGSPEETQTEGPVNGKVYKPVTVFSLPP